MNLTEHFTLEEMVASSTAVEKGIDNTPSAAIVDALRATCEQQEKVRAILGVPMVTRSGYRCPALNEAVGGSKTSDHQNGKAHDFVAPEFGTPLEICRAIVKSGHQFDQLIEEGTWVHAGYGDKMRGEVLTKGQDGALVEGLSDA